MNAAERERHLRASEIFAALGELPEGERPAALAQACGGDGALRAEVESLLECDSRAGAFLAGTAHQAVGLEPPRAGLDAEPLVLEQVGHYRVLSVLGEGGMGVVYEAEQVSPQRRVALKVLREGLATPGARRRFEVEAEILGRLQHPGIARIFEAGTAETTHGQRPFFAMELVRGRPLVEYARSERLGIRARLKLFVKVCAAIEHAHQKGVVHRDIKPSNILVDGEGEPHVLDFGVARTVDHEGRRETWRTGQGQLLGTLPYMSPEQASGDLDAVDTRSDVYALGVILFELLSGRLPHDIARVTFPQAVLAITEREPTSLASIDRRFAGDLDTIVAKALSKERERRYSSASDLAADVRRYLDNEPIVARPASTLYHLRKFAARNKALVSASAAVFLALLVGLVLSTVGLRRARDAERESKRLLESTRLSNERLEAQVLTAEVEELGPALPGSLARYEDWLGRVERLQARALVHLDILDALRAGAPLPDTPPEERPSLEVAERTCRRLQDLQAVARRVAERLDRARTLARLMGTHAADWAAARAAIAASPHYGGLDLPPQLGLVPLRENPETGLWEFWHVASGERPASRVDGVSWLLTEHTGLVLVLLPGGTFRMGAEARPGDGPNVDARARPNEGPVREVPLDPFFLSKYEVTQGQWLRWAGPPNPSLLQPGDDAFEITLLHPLENITAVECEPVLAGLDLLLPTEAQWEYACRAGTASVWWTGNDERSLQLAENLCDAGDYEDDYAWPAVDTLFDGFRASAPVGSLRPNPFGLYDIAGNVSEQVRGYRALYDAVDPAPGDGFRGREDNDDVVRRGGAYRGGLHLSRSAARQFGNADNRNPLCGVRPARAVRPTP